MSPAPPSWCPCTTPCPGLSVHTSGDTSLPSLPVPYSTTLPVPVPSYVTLSVPVPYCIHTVPPGCQCPTVSHCQCQCPPVSTLSPQAASALPLLHRPLSVRPAGGAGCASAQTCPGDTWQVRQFARLYQGSVLDCTRAVCSTVPGDHPQTSYAQNKVQYYLGHF